MTSNKSFIDNGYAVIRQAIGKETAKLIAIEFNMLRDNTFYSSNVDLNSVGFLNDATTELSFAWYSAYCSEALVELLLPKIEEVVGRKLYPSYSYSRIYYNGAVLNRHIDRPGSDYAVSITIDIDDTQLEPWPIHIKNFKGEDTVLTLDIGDVCVYHGDKLEHWREPYKGKKQIQSFLFYVADESNKFDSRPMLGASSDTKKFK
jgi:hypothetical protein